MSVTTIYVFLRKRTALWLMHLCIAFLPSLSLAQPCIVGTPSYSINLTGKADSVWNSTSITRDGECCSISKCVQFILTLDPNATGIKLEIVSGSIPSGSLTYQIGCGGAYSFGQEVCLSGSGPYSITFCKPGNNANIYRITSIARTKISGQAIMNRSCTGLLSVVGLIDSTIQWSSVPNNTTYNQFLSCTNACDSTYLHPGNNTPDTLKYKVCGTIVGGCATSTTCDTLMVRITSNISVSVSPDSPSVCYNDSSTTLTANGSGGVPPYSWLWSNGASTKSISKGVGIYTVQMQDSIRCMTASATKEITKFNTPISANAGPDQTLCANNMPFVLSGSVTTASGGIWSNALGTFSSGNTSLAGNYFPSSNEKTNGVVWMILTTTGNKSCPAAIDSLKLTIHSLPPTNLNASSEACASQQTGYSVTPTLGYQKKWTVTGGNIIGSDTTSNVNVLWNSSGTGNLNIKLTNAQGCDSTATKSIQLFEKPIPKVIFHH